jgi:hypothetical protein
MGELAATFRVPLTSLDEFVASRPSLRALASP